MARPPFNNPSADGFSVKSSPKSFAFDEFDTLKQNYGRGVNHYNFSILQNFKTTSNIVGLTRRIQNEIPNKHTICLHKSFEDGNRSFNKKRQYKHLGPYGGGWK
jgi:hypothetical protein